MHSVGAQSAEESEDDYAWALRQFNDCFKLLINETNMAIVVYRELALISGIKATFPNTAVLVCLWHVNKNRESSQKISAERMKLPIRLKALFWGNVVRIISSYALYKAMLRQALENLDSPHVFVMRNPVVARTRGRPSGSQNSSTKRDPSLFEHVEANILKKRRCGVCKAEGHNKQTCPRIAVDAAVLDTRNNEDRIVSVSDDSL
ncbi:hypothetical protein PsorP6_007451 [Peronosclerospora sorghi]|uniref:Uncharacterized protein n=1 Tax=Peronosclerospora sorghi TaxID=230839 RepID=A0ACC0W6W0_9STRA|nr:hypothetical protein PsorP6_007451 [Peronosclerospora sorghi]